jgi:hypothetical protein
MLSHLLTPCPLKGVFVASLVQLKFTAILPLRGYRGDAVKSVIILFILLNVFSGNYHPGF